MNDKIIESIYYKNNEYQIIENNNVEHYFYIKKKVFFKWKVAHSKYIENKFDSLSNARKYLYKFDKKYVPYEPQSCPVLTGKAAEDFLNKLKENESKPKIDISEDIKIVNKIRKKSNIK